MEIPDLRLAFRAQEEGEIDRADLVRLLDVLETWRRGDLSVSCAELLASEFRVDSAKIRRWEAELAGQPSSRIGKYRLERRIGQGGMGVVYEAAHANLGRTVALKVLTPGARDPGAVQRFLREVKSAGRFNHPNIVHAYDAGIDGDIPYLVMEFVDGENLFQRLLRTGPVAVEDAVRWLAEATSALWFLESVGWTHGDGKPSNWVITEHGHLKLIDLGLCRPPGRPRDPELIHGSPPYIAPEQLGGGGRIDIRSDLHALGATFYHLLCGQPPYPARSVRELLRDHREHEISPLTRVRPGIPEALAAVIHRLLERDPQARFANCAELAQALASIPGGERVAAPTTSTDRAEVRAIPERRRAFSGRRGPLFAASLVLALFAGGVAARFLWRPPDGPTPEPRSERTDPPRVAEQPAPDPLAAEWRALRDRRPVEYGTLFAWLEAHGEDPRTATWRTALIRELDVEVDACWPGIAARARELCEAGRWSAALATLEEFPPRFRLVAHRQAHVRAVLAVRAAREARLAEYTTEIARALERSDPIAARTTQRRLSDEHPDEQAWLLHALAEEFGGLPWLRVIEDLVDAAVVSRVRRREELREATRSGAQLKPDWLRPGVEPAAEWYAEFLAGHPALLERSPHPALERLLELGTLTELAAEALPLVWSFWAPSDALRPSSWALECEAAQQLARAQAACRAWHVSAAEAAWAVLEEERLAATTAGALCARQLAAARSRLSAGAFLRSGALRARVEGEWGAPPTLHYDFTQAETFEEWRHQPSRWQVTPTGSIALAPADGRDPPAHLTCAIPFAAPSALRIRVALPERGGVVAVRWQELTAAIAESAVDVRALVGRAQVVEDLRAGRGVRLDPSPPGLAEMELLFELRAGVVRCSLGASTVELEVIGRWRTDGWPALELPSGSRLREVAITGDPSPEWVDARRAQLRP